MLLQDPNLKVWLYNQSTDMRKQYDGLIALVKNTLQEAPAQGDLFVFINRKRTMIKILYYSKGGYCLWGKRLEQGQFHRLVDVKDKISLNWAQLQCLIDGLNWQMMKKSKRFSPAITYNTPHDDKAPI